MSACTLENIGLGVDLVEVNRFAGKIYSENRSFFDKIFTTAEIEYCLSKQDPTQHWAVRFAGKEATIKALGDLGVFHYTYKDIEIRNENNVPKCYILEETKALEGYKIKISLTHTENYAVASVLILRI